MKLSDEALVSIMLIGAWIAALALTFGIALWENSKR